ncbi:unnamed protein product [Rhodiola kirilowii]
MSNFDLRLADRISDGTHSHLPPQPSGGLFLEPAVPHSFLNLISLKCNGSIPDWNLSVSLRRRSRQGFGGSRRRRWRCNQLGFLCVGLSDDDGIVIERKDCSLRNEGEMVEQAAKVERRTSKVGVRGGSAINTTKHLWAGAIAAMVSRTCVAPLERLKLEYIVRGEQKHLFDLVRTIAATQGLKGFWKGNLVNILRTAPFKAINFCAYDTYRKQLLKFSGNEETSHFERFIAGAAAGITATVLCLPLDTVRTKLVAPGGEALGGVIGAFHHLIQTEGVFALYKGLVPSIISMAPSGAVFYGVYDTLKSAYLRSPEGRNRIQNMNQHGHGTNAFSQLELGPVRTLLYGAISGACAEASTYPFEVLRRRLQMQVQATRLSTLATFVKIVEQGGVPALYAGLLPSLLQVLPSASISFFVYEFMKIVLKVE